MCKVVVRLKFNNTPPDAFMQIYFHGGENKTICAIVIALVIKVIIEGVSSLG